MVSHVDEIFIHHRLQFQDSLKDLRNLRKQLYSAAEYFESSYDQNDEQPSVMESSKDYVAKALVNTVDHLGSVADKLNSFLDEKTNEFSATNIRFSCIQQRLNTFQGFVDLRGVAQHSLMTEAPKHHKQYIIPAAETFPIAKSKLVSTNYASCPQYEVHQPKQDNPLVKGFQAGRMKPPAPCLRKKGPSSESSPKPLNFPFTNFMSNKELGKRSVSPLRFSLKRSGSINNRSVSRSSIAHKQRSPSEPRRAIAAHTKPKTTNSEIDIEPYTKRSKHLFKSLLDVHWTRK